MVALTSVRRITGPLAREIEAMGLLWEKISIWDDPTFAPALKDLYGIDIVAIREEEATRGHEEGLRKGHQTGLQEGRAEALRLAIAELAAERFRPLPEPRARQLAAADLPQLERWLPRLLSARDVDGLFDA